VLNNIWVSLPVGSEESYTFRHMRKNQYEEALFRCEDERFEIDMVLDANHSTIRILEPLVEEISLLQYNESSEEGAVTPDGDLPPASRNVGAGGSRFQYKLDKRTLSVHHVNSITRIYGDSGNEILEMMYKVRRHAACYFATATIVDQRPPFTLA